MMTVEAVQIETLPCLSHEALRHLPSISAVYFVVGQDNTVHYIGQSSNLWRRWNEGHHHQRQTLYQQAPWFLFWLALDPADLLVVEAQAIAHFAPIYNVYRPPTTNLQEELEAIFYKFYGNLDGLYMPRV